MTRFEDFLKALKDGLKELVANSVQDFSQAATKDGQAFFKKARADLEQWTKALARRQLTKADFEWLVQGKKDLAGIAVLQQAGLALGRADPFRSPLLGPTRGTAGQACPASGGRP